ncbi:MAG: SulP family inorganic anion transporter [Ilumatobacter sp.]|uniref:SulP family inorganic anion transporter n=1 Tax=Ilumatobacter sp. TaxID=1967498 RepID=UPI002629108F|nr:SulP family inorganic anion transporter [Ilumatobacter sp.]MDJ0770875.1 SulP family inorganic anion transporter [Ilumatobacter sp.]
MSARSLPQLVRRGEYERAWLRPDVLAGLTVAAMVVPQAMAYAELGGLPPSAGFRAVLVALPIYVLIGTSRHLGIGPEPGTAILAAAAAAGLAGGDPDRYAALMATIGVLVGLFALLAGVLRLGFVADLLSKPVLVGYITGVGTTLLTSQLRSFTGVSIDADNPFRRVWEFVTSLDQIDGATVGIGLATLAVIMLLRRYRPTWPGALIGLGGSMVTVALLDLDVGVVGDIEAALPRFGVPDVGWGDVGSLVPAAAGVALIGYTDNILTARSISAKQDYEVDADRELFALGAMNTVGGFAGGFPMSSSASRSFVPATIGSKSQLSSAVTFVAVLVFLLVGRSLLAEIPSAGLAAVIVAAAFAVIDVAGFRRLAKLSRAETALAAITCLAVIGIDILVGVLVAVGLSVLITLGRVARPHDAVLGAGGEDLDGWIELDDERATPLPGLLVYRFDAPLFFANGEYYRERLQAALVRNPGEETGVILDMEGIGSIDTTAVDHLAELFDDLEADGITISLARPNHKVHDMLIRSGLQDRLGEERVYPTINAAVAAYQRRSGPGRPGGPTEADQG